ncbi:polyprotein [rhinovirus C19]|uniref:Genome polyprotein n=1 Tax=rhinovirus C11 TaxID=1240004 RepID=A0A5C2D4K4_9ENTO|nr:polyprotein [rhinovirus C19]
MGAQVSKQNVGSHENSVSASNGSVIKYFNINYYKDSASSGLTKQDFSQDPSKFTQPLVDTLTNPALMSPSVEACGFSDRLKQITIGNSTITTQDSLNTILAYGEWPSYLSDLDATSVDKPSHPETSSDRFYTLESVNWESGSKGWWWKFPDALKDMGMFGQNMYHHSMGRFGALIHVQCNATKFHSGCLLIMVVPEHQLAYIGAEGVKVRYEHTHPGERGHTLRDSRDRSTNNPDDNPFYMCNGTLLGNGMIYPHQMINLRTNNSATIVIPYINCIPMDNMLRHNNFSLVIVPIVPLRPGNSGAPILPITVTIAPYKSEFSGAMKSQPNIPNITESTHQGIPTRAPAGSQQFMTTEDEQSPNILPEYSPTKEIHIPGKIDNMLHIAMVDSLIPINNQQSHAGQVAMYNVQVFKRSDTDLILALPLQMDNTLFATTLLGEVLNYFGNWSGSIKVTFMCVCDSFSSGKFLVAYTPPGGGVPTNRKEAMLGTHLIWDLGLQSSCTLVAPWMSSTFYRRTKGDAYTSGGYITLWYQTDFIPSSSGGVGTILATCSACPDLSVRMMRDTPMIKQPANNIQNPVEEFIDTTLKEVLVVPNNPASGPTHTTHPSTLGAMEIGATADITPADTIETRYVINNHTNNEAIIENFLGRSSLWAELSLGNKKFCKWDISFQEQAHIRKKMEWFTYVRFDMEVTVVTNNHSLMQIMFIPPGIDPPSTHDDKKWNGASNPSVFYQPKSGFPRFTIPFTGLGAAYYIFYDGYDENKAGNVNYGISATNDMGTLCFRSLEEAQGTDIKVYIKPKHITAWCPRAPRAVDYTHKHSPNYHTKVNDTQVLKEEHYIEFRDSPRTIVTAGPSDLYVHTADAIYRNAHLTTASDDTILLAITADLQVDAAHEPGPDYIPDCDCTEGCYYSKSLDRYIPVQCVAHDWYPIEESSYYPKHIQYNILLGEGHCQPGDCGGKLLCKHGVIGIITAGGEDHVAFTDLRPYRSLSTHQGPIGNYINQLGTAFGDGFTTAIKSQLDMLGNTVCDQLTGKVIKWLVRVISAITIMVRNSSDIPTVLATLALLGCHTSPWSFLKDKVCKWLGIPAPARKQGDNWLKKFTEWCNAAKGLEWVGVKISKFIDWIKSKVIPQVKSKKELLEHCKRIPLYQEQVKGFPYASEESQNELMINIEKLKKGLDGLAPLYAAENKIVTNLHKELKQLQCYKRTKRTEPVCLMIHGPPGCGKSLVTTVIARGLATEGDIYSLPPNPKHFDGYNQQKVVIMDDVGQNPDGEDLSTFCQMVSTADFHVPMAALEDKGRSFTSDFVLASTNLASLVPQTVQTPEALLRRFYLDTELKALSNYVEHGLLNTAKALQPCTGCPKPKYYSKCCPLLCGKAVVLYNKRTQASYSINMVVEQLREECANRKSVGKNLSAIFQGLGDDETPGFIIDLLRASKDPKVIQYCEDQGLIVQTTSTIERHIDRVQHVLNCLGSLTLILGTLYALYKLMCMTQGAYSGMPTPVIKRPELRRATVQGPEHEFMYALIKRNCHIVETDKGEFNMLGIYDNCAVLPTHANCGDSLLLNGIKTPILKQQIITDLNDTDTEITIIWLDRNEKFRDIRRFLPESIQEWDHMRLATNVSKFPMFFADVGSVTPYGEINLSGNPTCRLLKYDYPTRPGQCGGVIGNTGHIIGIHVGGNGRVGYCAALLRKYFAECQGEIVSIRDVREEGIKPVNTPTHTKLRPSVFYDVFPGCKEPAALSNNDPRLETNLDDAVLAKYKGNPKVEFNEFIQVAVDHYAAQLYPLDINPSPISIEQAVYGYPNLEPLDLTTSAGYPYTTLGVKKRDIFNKQSRDVVKMQELLDKYGVDLPYVTYLKDELRAPEKIRSGKTRIIEAASVNDTVNFRMIYGNLFSMFHANPGIQTGSAVGCNPDTFWSQLYSTMGGHLLAFDYTNYDGSIHPIWFDALGKVLDQLGFPGHLMKRLNSTRHIYKNAFYITEGGMPSGICGTSIFNTMINNIIIRTLVIQTYKHIDLDKLRIVAYGDDVIASYPELLDPQEIANTAKVYGLTITPADKSATFKPITWENVTFLKRGFRPDKRYPFLVHPIYSMSDIFESIRWTKDPKNTQDHVRSLCLMAWHNGEAEYNNFLSKIRSVSVGRTLELPPYSYLYQQWVDNFV